MRKMYPALSIALAAGLLAVLSSVSCDRLPTSQPGARGRADAANPLRATIGLRQIGPQWQCYRSNHRLDEWAAVQGGLARDKAVQYDGEGKLVWEEDSYVSGRKLWIDEQTVEEQLVVHYDYPASHAELYYLGDDAVVQGLVDGASGADTTGVLAAADRILKGWGIRRL